MLLNVKIALKTLGIAALRDQITQTAEPIELEQAWNDTTIIGIARIHHSKGLKLKFFNKSGFITLLDI